MADQYINTDKVDFLIIDTSPKQPTDSVSADPTAEGKGSNGPERPRLRRIWWIAFVAFLMLPAAWALSTPYNGAYDEHAHAVRAAGVVRGQILVPPLRAQYDGGYQYVPRSLVPPNHDCLGEARVPASCLGTPSNDRTLVPVQTGAARYNPAYYAVVGWPLAVLPNLTGILLTRLISAALCALLLASALVTIWPVRRQRFLMLAMLCATTPILICLNSLVNPSGMEIDAAILLWAVLARLFSSGTADDGAGPNGPADTRRLVILATVAGTVLALGRPATAVVAGVILVLTAIALARRGMLVELARRRDVRVGALVVAAATLFGIVWIFVSQVTDFGAGAKPVVAPTSIVIRTIVVGHFNYWTHGTVGLFGYGNIPLPTWVLFAWGAMQGTLVLLGFGLARRRRLAYTIAAIPVICYGAAFVVEMIMARIVGYFVQGRYFLPVWVGMFFLAALAIRTRAFPASFVQRFYLVSSGLWFGSVALGLYLTINHYQYGETQRHNLPLTWSPIYGKVPPYLALAVGLGLMGWLVWRYLREHRDDFQQPEAVQVPATTEKTS